MVGYLQSPNDKNIEQEIQSKLGNKHMRGEWFNIGKIELVEMIKQLGYFDIYNELNLKAKD